MTIWVLVILLMNGDGSVADYGIAKMPSEEHCAARKERGLAEKDPRLRVYCTAVTVP